MSAIELTILLAAAGGAATLVLGMGLELWGRSRILANEAGQIEANSILVTNLRSEGLTPQIHTFLGRLPHRLARRALSRALELLGEPYRQAISSAYERAGFPARASRDIRSLFWTRRAEAALEMAALRHPEAGDACLRLLRDRRPEVRMAAARAINRLGLPNALKSIFESIPVPTRWAISSTLKNLQPLPPTASIEIPQILVESGSRTARLAAIEALGELRYAPAVPLIDPYLLELDGEFRIYATRALGRIGAPGVAARLARMIKDPVWEVRAAAARGLGSCPESEAVPFLLEALDDPVWWVRLNAAESLAVFDAQGSETLKQALSSPGFNARQMAERMLRRLQAGGAA